MLSAVNLTCENEKYPIGLPTFTPRFSWIIESDEKSVKQKSYILQISTDKNFENTVYDSGKIESEQSVLVKADCSALVALTKYYYRVKIFDNFKNESDFSAAEQFVIALPAKNWKALMISAEEDKDELTSGATLVFTKYNLVKPLKSAYICASSCGMYNLTVNDIKMQNVLAPGFTEYEKRILFQTYDVTDMVKNGENIIAAQVGSGWYKGNLGWEGKHNIYGEKSGFIAEIVLTFADGSTEIISTDENWDCGTSPVVYSEIYHGETYDARLEKQKYIQIKKAKALKFDINLLVPEAGPLVTKHERLAVKAVITTPLGETVLDFGQNLCGWVAFDVCGNAGEEVELDHAEILDENGNFYTKNLRSAKQAIRFISSGEDTHYEPNFTFQGFRYVRVNKYPKNIDKNNFTAVVVHSNLAPVGSFSCSNKLLNQLESNIRWGMKGNFIDIPTDCPQRDERLGWTGDAQVFNRTASFLMNTSNFFKKWLQDVSLSQIDDGGIPFVVPDLLSSQIDNEGNQILVHSGCGWGDVATVCPYNTYKYFGDIDVLINQYDCMKRWVNYIKNHSENGLLWNQGFHFGDWVALDAKEGSYNGATPNDLLATAYFALSTNIVAKTAKILGNDEDFKKYSNLYEKIKTAYVDEFFTSTGRIVAKTQTAYAISLYFGLVPEQFIERTLKDFVALLSENNDHLSTGFLGTPYICHALAENDHLTLAYKLLLQEDYPSWLYPIIKGATTIWEHWDGIKPDDTRWSDDMNSFNHYAYGAIGDFLYSVVAGVDTSETEVGFKHSIIAPKPGGGLTYANASQMTPYGKLSCNWKIADANIEIDICIPHNTTSSVTLPFNTGETLELGSGNYSYNYKIESYGAY